MSPMPMIKAAASALNARTLVLIHTSSRYTDAQRHVSDAQIGRAHV